jgi:WD40 repeat protein
VCFSRPDGKHIVSAGGDATVRVWDTETGELLARLRGHEGSVNSVTFTPDGKRIVSGSSDGTIRIWESERWTNGLGELARPVRPLYMEGDSHGK